MHFMIMNAGFSPGSRVSEIYKKLKFFPWEFFSLKNSRKWRFSRSSFQNWNPTLFRFDLGIIKYSQKTIPKNNRNRTNYK